MREDDWSSTDLALTYSFNWKIRNKETEVFIQPRILNVFDEDASSARLNADIDTFGNGGSCPDGAGGFCEDFNAFTETPLEGVHWSKRSGFGEPDDAGDFQYPRSFDISVGFRF
jgi:hypothetical protein